MHLFLFVFFFFGSSTNHLFEKIPQMKWLMVTNMAMKSTHEANSDTECFDVLQMFPWAHTSYRSLEFQGISNPHNTRQSYHTHITHHWRVKQVCCNQCLSWTWVSKWYFENIIKYSRILQTLQYNPFNCHSTFILTEDVGIQLRVWQMS